MSEEREKLNRVLNRSRARIAYVSIGFALALVFAAVMICILLLNY